MNWNVKSGSHYLLYSSSIRYSERPSIPPLFLIGLSFWLSCAAFLTFASTLNKSFRITIAVSVVVIGLLSCLISYFTFKRKKNQVLVLLFFVVAAILGLLLSEFQLELLEIKRNQLSETTYDTFSLSIIDSPVWEDRGYSCTASVVNSKGVKASVRLYLNGDSAPSFGESISGRGSFSAPEGDSLSYYQTNGLCGYISLDSFEFQEKEGLYGEIISLRNSYLGHWEGDNSESATFLKALLLGERGELYNADFYQDVKVLGLAHIIAVSGAHLVIISALISFVLSRLPLPRIFSVGLQLLFILFYLVLVGVPLPCLRAACMSFVSLSAPMLFRRSSPLANLGLAFLVLLALDPFSSVSLSFVLSALATLGIILFMPLFSNLLSSISVKIPSWFRDPLLMTLASLIFVTPISTASFSQFSLIAPLANILATPLVSVLCCLGMIMLLLSPVPLVGDLLFSVCTVLSELFIMLCSLLVNIPFVSVPVTGNLPILMGVSVAVAAMLWLLWPRRIDVRILGSLFACFLIVLFVGQMGSQGNRIIMLNVGQGDAILIQSEGKTILVDTGNQDTLLLAGLARYGITSLDAVVISHADDDHCGSLSALRGVVSVKTVVLAQGANSVSDPSAQDLVTQASHVTGGSITYVSTNDVIRLGSLSLTVVNPDSVTTEYGNEESLCLVVSSDDNHDSIADSYTLLCGDAECEVIEPLVEEHIIPRVDIVKVAHHGSRKALSKEMVEMLDPSLALISVGKNNSYGHPASETIQTLEKHRIPILRTDERGDVICNIGSSGLSYFSRQVQ